MHILGLIISIIIGAAVWYWRIKMLRSAASEAIDVAQTLANLPRKMRFKNAANKGKVGEIDDPRFAVSTLLYMLVLSDGALKENEENLIRSQLQIQFKPNYDELIEMEVLGRWAAGELARQSSATRDLVRQIKKLAPEARNELLTMVHAIEGECRQEAIEKVSSMVEKEFRVL